MPYHVVRMLALDLKNIAGKGLWLQGEAFRDAEQQLVIPPNAKKNLDIVPNQLRPGLYISLTTTDRCLPSTAWQYSKGSIQVKEETALLTLGKTPSFLTLLLIFTFYFQ